MARLRPVALLACLGARVATAQASGAPAGPPAADTARTTVLMAGRTAGIHKAWRGPDGSRNYYFEFNDRGRGPALTERVVLGADGYPRRIDVTGHDYLKSPIEEHFVLEQRGGAWHAAWKSQAESASVTMARPTYYVAVNEISTDLFEPLVLAAPAQRLAMLPQGEARIERVRDLAITAGDRRRTVTLYATHGLGFTPSLWWADEGGRFFAGGSSWMMFVREGWESAQPELLKAQAAYDAERTVAAARSLARRPKGPVAFRNANLFDAETGRMRPGTTVIVTGNRITAVGEDGRVVVPAGAEVIDVGGKTLMPGMWDMHVHTTDDDGLLHLAAGVTTVRDLANDTEETLARKRRIADGTLLGPRMILAGFMDGPGPYAGPTKVLVSSADSARAWVNRYADLGYEQIKIYSSIDPAIVPAIIDAAHRRGMRLSGHVPQGMTAEELVRAGADELQHVNFLFLNFWRDSVKDTRTPERFTAPAQRAALLDLGSDRVRRFIALLRERGTTIDPTVVTFEGMLTGRPGTVDPAYAAVAARLPASVRRGMLGGGLPVPEGMDQRYRASFGGFKRMVKAMYDAGVPIVAGTDALPGFAYHRELELYEEAGIPAPEVLRIATINAAKIMKHDRELGSVVPGKLADLVVVNGSPATRVSDVRRVTLVMKDGILYDPAALYRGIGVTPAAGMR
ncbi:MAG TPA: amidohydrolase family protein [Gemmatimonadaceae bacterium]|nr:amidohydrolase family protein [Gemmatimonadaceae bacterium]